MQVSEAVVLALKAAWSHKLRSFFTLLASSFRRVPRRGRRDHSGMNAYVRERIGADRRVNAFQVRRTPDRRRADRTTRMARDRATAHHRRPMTCPSSSAPLPMQGDRAAVGWPTPMADVVWRNRTVEGCTTVRGHAPFQNRQDYEFARGCAQRTWTYAAAPVSSWAGNRRQAISTSRRRPRPKIRDRPARSSRAGA